MKSILRRRPSPALVIACIALFVSLGGVSYGVATGFIDSREIKNNTVRSKDMRNNTLRTFDIRNNEIRGFDVRNSSIQGRDVAFNTLTGQDIAEEDLGQVPSAADAAALGGKPATDYVDNTRYLPFSATLTGGETRVLATNGTVSIEAFCDDTAGATNTDDQIRVLAGTTSSQAVLEGLDDFAGGISFLTSTTPPANRRLAQSGEQPDDEVNVNNGVADQDTSGGFVIGPDGKGLVLELESLALGTNYAGGKCFAAGLIVPVG